MTASHVTSKLFERRSVSKAVRNPGGGVVGYANRGSANARPMRV